MSVNADEAPPLVPVIDLTRHVRSAKGAAFYHKSIGTILTGDDAEAQYSSQKAKNDAAKAELREIKQEKKATSSSSHSELLAARKAARAKHPVGHPDRLAAERAVRNSRKSTSFKDARGNVKQAQPSKKSTSTSNKRQFLIAGGASTSATTTGVGGSFSPSAAIQATDQVASRLKELNSLSDGERSQYFALRNAGLQHDRAMKQIHERRSRPVVAKKVVKAVASRRSRR